MRLSGILILTTALLPAMPLSAVRDSVPPPRCTITDLGTFGGDESMAFDINNRGEIVGLAQMKDQSRPAFLWRAGKKHLLGSLEGYSDGKPYSLNDRGEIVGEVISRGE